MYNTGVLYVHELYCIGTAMVRPALKDRSTVLSKVMQLRIRADEHKRWVEAAQKQGRTLSAWARAMLDRAARTG